MPLPFTLERKITVGEMLTIASIVFSAISVLITWQRDQNLQSREYATKTRIEIAKTLNTLDRVVHVQLSFYDLIEEDIVETSRISVLEKAPGPARDYIWEKFFRHRAELKTILAQNDWEIAYLNLMPYNIKVDTIYMTAIRKLQALQENEFKLMLREFEQAVLRSNAEQTSILIDRLRKIKETYRDDHLTRARKATEQLSDFALSQIRDSDKRLFTD